MRNGKADAARAARDERHLPGKSPRERLAFHEFHACKIRGGGLQCRAASITSVTISEILKSGIGHPPSPSGIVSLWCDKRAMADKSGILKLRSLVRLFQMTDFR
jgi:hypothetical protein